MASASVGGTRGAFWPGGAVAPWAVGALLVADLVLVLAYLALHLPGHDVRLLSLGAERSIPTWYASAKMLVLAQLLGLVAWSSPAPTRRARLALFAPAALFLLMSVDETASLHERIAPRAAALLGGGAAYWPHLAAALLAAVLTAAGAAFVRLVRPPAAAVAGAAGGAAVFLLGAAGLDAVRDAGTPGHAAGVLWHAAEEGCELLGLTLITWAVVRLGRRWAGEQA